MDVSVNYTFCDIGWKGWVEEYKSHHSIQNYHCHFHVFCLNSRYLSDYSNLDCRHFWAVLRDSKTYQKCKYLIFIFILKYTTLLIFLQFIMLISACWRTGRLVRRVYSGHMIFHNPIWLLTILLAWPALLRVPCPPTIYYVSLYGKGFWKEIFHSVLLVPASDFVLGISIVVM